MTDTNSYGITPEEYEELQRKNRKQKEDAWCNEHRLNQRDYQRLQVQFDKTPDPAESSASAQHMIAMALLNELGHRPNSRGEVWVLMQRLLACGPANY